MDDNNNSTAKYRRQSLDQSDINLTLDPEKPSLSKPFKYYLFGLTSCIYLIYGCQNSLLGPTLQDLTVVLHTTEQNLALVMSVKCLVIILSTFSVNFFFEKFGQRQFQFATAVIVFSILGGLTPFFSSFLQLLIASVFSGFVTAFIEAVVNLTVLELFSLNSKIYMQMMHGCFTIGTIFGPILSAPFLSKKGKTNETTGWTTTEMPSTSPVSLFEEIAEAGQPEGFETQIEVPYVIVSVLLILAAVWLIVSQIRRPYVPEKRKLAAKQTSKRIVEEPPAVLNGQNEKAQNGFAEVAPANEKPKVETVIEQIEMPLVFYMVFLGLVGTLFAFYMCMEGMVSLFLPSFLEKGLNFDRNEAGYMSSVVFVSMAVGRVFTIVFSMRITCKIMLFFNFTILLVGFIFLTFFAVHYRLIVWISMILIGGGLSSTYPIILSYVENRIVITNRVQLYLLLSSLVLMVFVPILIGRFINTLPMLFAYTNLSMAFAALGLMVLMHLVDVWKRKLILQIKQERGFVATAEQIVDYNI